MEMTKDQVRTLEVIRRQQDKGAITRRELCRRLWRLGRVEEITAIIGEMEALGWVTTQEQPARRGQTTVTVRLTAAGRKAMRQASKVPGRHQRHAA